jgi:hypothetical protein
MDIELLAEDDQGNPIKGTRFPRDLGVARYDPENPNRLAYRHTFYRYDDEGRAVEDSLIEFYVPSYRLTSGSPNRAALRLVERKMGWGRNGT